jgi:hypothetical protein
MNEHQNKLFALIESENKTELECKAFLKFSRDLLVKTTPYRFVEEKEEYINHLGISDYLIVCDAKDTTGIVARQAYIWETKAPQCFLFEADTANRVMPTKDFISAENQLLHYYDECRESGVFRTEFGILEPKDIILGGIIIGSQKRKVKTTKEFNYSPIEIDKLFKKALNLRKTYLYGHPNGIQVILWDTIFEFLGDPITPKQNQPSTLPSVTDILDDGTKITK